MGEVVITGNDVEITEEIAEDLKLFLQQSHGDDVRELAEILNIDISDKTEKSDINDLTKSEQIERYDASKATHICELPDSRCQEIAKQVAQQVDLDSLSDGIPEWETTYTHGGKITQDAEQYQLIIKTERKTGSEEQYFNKIIFTPEDGIKTVWTMTNVMIDWNQRIQLEQQRGEIIKSVISVAVDEDLDIGGSMCDLELTTEYEPSIDQF